MKYTADDIEKIYQNSMKAKLPKSPEKTSNTKLPTINSKTIQNSKLPTVNQEKPQSIIRNTPSTSLTKKKYTAEDIEKMLGPSNNLPTKAQQENETLIDKLIQPIDNFKSNYSVGKLSEQENKAWSEYRKNQTKENLKKAQEATKIKESFIKQNDVGQGNILTKDFAQYTPQMINQIVAGLSGASETALPGAGVGASAALIAGQVGPQVLAPEEIITVPAGVVAGAVAGGKTGYIKGVAEYSYDNMAGSAYKQLLDLGVPNDIAFKVSGDEALISSLIEAAGAGIDIATLGITNLFSKGATNATTKVAKNRLISALKAYGVNIVSEGIEEGLQEKVSIESEKRALKQSGIKRNSTNEEDLQRIIESVKGGAAIATVTGAGNAIGNVAVNTINNKANRLPTLREQTENIKLPTKNDIESSQSPINNIPTNLNSDVLIENKVDSQIFIPRIKTETKNTQVPRIKEVNQIKPQNQELANITNITKINKKLPTEKQLKILEEADKRIQEAEIISDDEKIADVLTRTETKKLPAREEFRNSIDAFKRKFIDSGNTISTIAKEVKDSTLYTLYNNARQTKQSAEFMITEAQTDITGKVVGESLTDIFEPIRKKGDDYYKKFNEYMYHKHNVSRMTQGKPVFGESVTAEVSNKKIAEFERLNPEFKAYANKVYKYNRNLMQFRVDTGLISQEQANTMDVIYPYYVPTHRKISITSGAKVSGRSVEIVQGIKGATGSNKDLLPLHEQMARQTMQVVQAGRRNLFGNRLLTNVLDNKDKLGKYIKSVEKRNVDTIFEDIDNEYIPDINNTFTIYNNGKATRMNVNDGVFEGLKAISSSDREVTKIEQVARSLNDTFKKLITAYNPMFLVRNFSRDIQDAGLYTKDLKAFTKNYPRAWKEIASNSELWKQYQALGGFGSSVFDYNKGYNENLIGKKGIMENLEKLNFWTEQSPRFTEFLATIENGDGSYENLMEAMYNSADVTVNFGRSGTWGKTLNSTFVPFFNPAIQGTDKLIRQFTETKGVKNWTQLVIKATVLGIAPSLINSLVYDDDDEFEKITNRDKDTYFLFKIGQDQWAKIPKGRVLSLFGNAAQRTLRTVKDEEDAWAGFINTAVDNTLPMNPITNNIYSPFHALKTNTTWYGTPIEGQRLQAFRPGERYDEKTDYLSKWLGMALNYSPKKINYLLDSYSGVIGDFVLPLMTPRAEANPVKKSFILDSTTSNKISQNFYDKADEIKYAKNSIDEDNVNDVIYRFINKQSSAAGDLYSEIRNIEKSNLKDSEKKVKVKEITATINGIQQNALNNLPEYEKAANKYFEKYKNVDDAYLYANKELFGAEYAIKVYNKKTYEKYLNQRNGGLTADEFFKAQFEKETEIAKNAFNSLPTINSKKSKNSLPTVNSIKFKSSLPTIKDKK